MLRKKTRRKKPETKPVHIAIRVERSEIRAEASINHDAAYPEYAYELDDRDPIYQFTSNLTIAGTAFAPKERVGHAFEVTIYGHDSPSSMIHAQLKDLHRRDEKGMLQYRTLRGKTVPVYAKPPGLALLSKERGKSIWTAWVRVLPRLASDMLVLLASGSELFLAITEVTDEPARRTSGLAGSRAR